MHPCRPLEMLCSPACLRISFARFRPFRWASMGNGGPALCDRSVPDFHDSPCLAGRSSSRPAQGARIAADEDPLRLCRGPNLESFDYSYLDFFAWRRETIQLRHLCGLRLDFREQLVQGHGFGRHRQFVVRRAPVIAFGAPRDANLENLLCHRSTLRAPILGRNMARVLAFFKPWRTGLDAISSVAIACSPPIGTAPSRASSRSITPGTHRILSIDKIEN